MNSSSSVVVVGAGIVGVTTALVLQAAKYNVSIVSEHSALDSDSQLSKAWSSPYAGANWTPFAKNDDPFMQEIELRSLRFLEKIADSFPESTVKRIFSSLYYSAENYKEPWFVKQLDGVSYIPRHKLPENVDIGLEFKTVILNAPEYLKWITGLYISRGGIIHKAKLSFLGQAIDFAPKQENSTPIVVNCAALGNLYLSDVKDDSMFPARGQTLLVKAPNVTKTVANIDVMSYVIPRGNGTVIVGGTYQEGNWTPTPDPETANNILIEALKICPQLVDETTPTKPQNMSSRIGMLSSRIIAQNVGLRPARKEGVCNQTSSVPNPYFGIGSNSLSNLQDIPVVHNYGHGGYGYQTSWSFAYNSLAFVNKLSQNLHSKL
ncbi:hypothetical protein BB559_004430 [Furculomyces boomerangus]|uniref:FAD dependent oxidoreductase domain-containing protein n=1 Tax=Furculomyces boomerangus TaxID=61424 RepID=A0A2T9YEQ8_9FUNG|nr:hypothetical protein BB559_004430 [Furculomyces boomerangus]